MDGVPVPNQREDEQQKSDQQQAGSLRGINRVPAVLAGRIVLAPGVRHEDIVRSAASGARLDRLLICIGRNRSWCYTTRRRSSSHACFPRE
jgi:hypothetical protein